MTPSSQNHLQERILRLLDGEMQAHEASALDAELRICPQSRALYLQLATLHSALESQYKSHSEIKPGRIIPIDRFLSRQRRRAVRIALLSAAAILTLAAIPLWLNQAKNREALASFQTTPDSSYLLSHSGKSGNATDQILHPGSRLKLESGRLEAKFSSGVRCVIDAPCELIVIGEKYVQIKQGLAWFHVTPQAHGFKVETRRLQIIDHGTEFGVIAGSDGKDEIHVTKGSVEAASRKSGKPGKAQILLAGQARKITAAGELIQTTLRNSLFPTQLFHPLAIRNTNFDTLDNLSAKNDMNGYGLIPDWASSGAGVGLSNQTQPFLTQAPHSGTHAAFIQGTGLISQSVSGFDSSKKYSVTYFVCERGLPGASTRTAISLDLGSTFYRDPQPIRKTNAFRRIVSGPLHVFGPTANIEIRAQPASGDAALLIDSVSISRAVPQVPDGGFEHPVQPLKAFKQAAGGGGGSLAGSAWTFSGGAGITTNGSDFFPQMTPEGSQAAVLQNHGAAIETTLHGFEPGARYRLRFTAAGRNGGAATMHVLLGGVPLRFNDSESVTPAKRSYQPYASEGFHATADNLTLRIHSTSAGSTFLDDLHFEFIAEAGER